MRSNGTQWECVIAMLRCGERVPAILPNEKMAAEIRGNRSEREQQQQQHNCGETKQSKSTQRWRWIVLHNEQLRVWRAKEEHEFTIHNVKVTFMLSVQTHIPTHRHNSLLRSTFAACTLHTYVPVIPVWGVTLTRKRKFSGVNYVDTKLAHAWMAKGAAAAWDSRSWPFLQNYSYREKYFACCTFWHFRHRMSKPDNRIVDTRLWPDANCIDKCCNLRSLDGARNWSIYVCCFRHSVDRVWFFSS